jgi:subfamily B ATP-binding cassette protein HlyB/CyaB
MSEAENENTMGKSLRSLIILAQLNQVALDGVQIDHSFNLEGRDPNRDEIMLIGKKSNLKMKSVRVQTGALFKQPVPCLLGDTQGGFIVLAKMEEGKALVLDPEKGHPEQVG